MTRPPRRVPTAAGTRIGPRLAEILARMVEAKLAAEGASLPRSKDGIVRRPARPGTN